jgi:Pyruvate/2-oxoacid:ferredoxin oxidoreductase delta subunit
MEKEKIKKHRLIKIDNGVVGPVEPRQKSIRPKKVGDYPGLPKPIMDMAVLYSSPRLMGPPICDELITLVEHMFTEEEASVFRHLKPFSRGQTAAQLAKASHRPISEVTEIMERLSHEKRYSISYGEGDKKRYVILPVVPGAFEAVLMRTSLDTLTDWHREFARRFEDLFNTGYIFEYTKHPVPFVRYLPVQAQVGAIPMAWPSDKLEVILDRYDSFSVGLCQCRMTADIVGKGCGNPLENCTAYGAAVDYVVREGMQRRVEKKDILEIKAEAESHGLITWMFQEDSGKGASGSCSCCGCCCGMLRSVSEFNMPGYIAPPHFVPKFDASKCSSCAKCAKACQMGAITVDTKNKTQSYTLERCVGCGLCAVVCDEHHAVEMKEYDNFNPPAKSWSGLLVKSLPGMLRTSWEIWRERK